jgi:4-amino-4-deoxy-L-arabinose transferase-like glycosyltransferase
LPPYGRRQLSLVLLLAAVMRASLPLAALAIHGDPGVFWSADTPSYVTPAKGLLASGRFESNGVADVDRTPGYPVLLLPGLVIGRIEAVTLTLQLLLGVLSVYLMYRIAYRLFGGTAALACGILYAVEPLAIVSGASLLTECLFTFLLVVFLHQALACLDSPSPLRVTIAALALAAAIYTRPIAIYLPFAVAAFALVVGILARRTRLGVTYAAAFLAINLVLVGAWVVRNYRARGYPAFSSVGDINLYFYQGSSIIAKNTGRSYYEVQDELGYNSDEQYARTHPSQAGWSKMQKYNYMGREGGRLVRENWRIYPGIHLRGMVVMMADPGAIFIAKMLKQYPETGGRLLGTAVDRGVIAALKSVRARYPFVFYLTFVLGVLLAVYLLLSVAGLITAWPQARAAVALLVMTAGYLIVIGGGPAATSRFREPVMPVLCLFGGVAISRVRGRARGGRRMTTAGR